MMCTASLGIIHKKIRKRPGRLHPAPIYIFISTALNPVVGHCNGREDQPETFIHRGKIDKNRLSRSHAGDHRNGIAGSVVSERLIGNDRTEFCKCRVTLSHMTEEDKSVFPIGYEHLDKSSVVKDREERTGKSCSKYITFSGIADTPFKHFTALVEWHFRKSAVLYLQKIDGTAAESVIVDPFSHGKSGAGRFTVIICIFNPDVVFFTFKRDLRVDLILRDCRKIFFCNFRRQFYYLRADFGFQTIFRYLKIAMPSNAPPTEPIFAFFRVFAILAARQQETTLSSTSPCEV